MNETSGKNKSFLITAAGVVIFLALGLYTMIFFPEREKKIPAPKQNFISENKEIKPNFQIEEIKPQAKSEEIKIEKPKPDWFVYVTGEVKNPGVYKISADSRIIEAVYAAGGFTEKADQASVNLASKLTDGLQINVLAKSNREKKEKLKTQARPQNNQEDLNNTVVIYQKNQAQSQNQFKTKTQNQTSGGKIDINSASAQELEKLNGVGPAIAKRIVEYRNSHGKFSSTEDLLKVKGIGKAKLEKMRPQITF